MCIHKSDSREIIKMPEPEPQEEGEMDEGEWLMQDIFERLELGMERLELLPQEEREMGERARLIQDIIERLELDMERLELLPQEEREMGERARLIQDIIERLELDMERLERLRQDRGALPTKFIRKFLEIPLIKFGVEHAIGLYGRVRDFNTITHKSFELAENVWTGAFVGRVTPFAQRRGICLAAQPLLLALHKKFDTIAANALQSLEDKVPVIKQEPSVLMSGMTGAVRDVLKQTKDRVIKASDRVLISQPVQTSFDLLASFLNTASKTLDKVLPPCANDIRAIHTTGEKEEKSERGWILLAQFLILLANPNYRVAGQIRQHIEK